MPFHLFGSYSFFSYNREIVVRIAFGQENKGYGVRKVKGGSELNRLSWERIKEDVASHLSQKLKTC
jgi:hypothetical protein